MKKIILFFILTFSVFTLSSGCFLKQEDERPLIITTLFPQYDFTKKIVGDLYNVVLLLPSGADAHTFEPTPLQIATAINSEMIIYTSEELEPWITNLKTSPDFKNVSFLDLSIFVDLHEGEEDDDHDHEIDPHYWTNPNNAIKMLDAIYENVSLLENNNSSEIHSRYTQYRESLINLDLSFLDLVNKSSVSTIIYAGHFAFGYLGEEYGINYVTPYTGFSTNEEPSASSIIELIDTMRLLNTNVIYKNGLDGSDIANSIAQDIENALILDLVALGNLSNEQFETGLGYVELMNQNLENLKIGMNYNG